jgi:hypothetical protein
MAVGAFNDANLGFSSTNGVFAEVLRKVRRFETLDGRANLTKLSTAARAVDLRREAASMRNKHVDVKHAYFADLSAQPSCVIESCGDIYSDDYRALEIRDSDGRLLAYRFRYPKHLFDALQASQTLLPEQRSQLSVRGSFSKRHYAVWADSAKELLLSSEFRRDNRNGAANAWLQANRRLFRCFSDVLRLLNPEMWVKMTSTYPFDWLGSKAPSFLCGAWPGVAINLGISGDGGGAHMDWLDDGDVFNLVAPWGKYNGGNVALLSLGMQLQLQPGEALLFYGSFLAYKVMEVQGIRNSIDMFYHKSVFDARERVYRKHGVEQPYA